MSAYLGCNLVLSTTPLLPSPVIVWPSVALYPELSGGPSDGPSVEIVLLRLAADQLMALSKTTRSENNPNRVRN